MSHEQARGLSDDQITAVHAVTHCIPVLRGHRLGCSASRAPTKVLVLATRMEHTTYLESARQRMEDVFAGMTERAPKNTTEKALVTLMHERIHTYPHIHP